jgi:hypothetical protein
MRVRGMLKGGVYQRFSDTFVALLKEGFIQWSLKTVSAVSLTGFPFIQEIPACELTDNCSFEYLLPVLRDGVNLGLRNGSVLRSAFD